MRETIILGTIFGILFFAASAIVSALAIKNATPSILWDIILWGGVAGVAIGLALIALYISSQMTGRSFMIPALLITFGISALVAGLVWHYENTETRTVLESDRPRLDRTLKVTCVRAGRPTHSFEDRNLYILQVLDPRYVSPEMVTAITWFPPGAGEINWDANQPKDLSRCSITNYGSTNLFKISFIFEAEFQEVVRNGSSISNGKTIKTIEVKTPEFDLGPSRRTEDSFYISNSGPHAVIMKIPTTATVYTSDSDIPVTVNLIPVDGRNSYALLWPTDLTPIPPAALPPTPAPPDTPKEK